MNMQRSLAAIGLAALLGMAAAMPTVAHAASPTPETRAAFTASLVQALGLPLASPAKPDFSDVPASSPDFGAIEAAYKAGWVSGEQPGVFDPSGDLTRAEAAKMEVLALGYSSQAQEISDQATAFKDDASIPSWARGYIAESVALHLISGFPNGQFEAGATLTTQDAAAFLRKLETLWSAGAYTVAVQTSPNPAAVGQRVNLSATVTPRGGTPLWGPSVTFTATSPDVVISGNTLIASAPGSYQVAAVYSANGQTYTGNAALAVSGPASSLRVVAPPVVVANGSTQTQVSVDLLDAEGNVAVGNSGTVVSLDVSGGAFALPAAPLTATTAAGVATFTLRDGSIPGAVSSLAATGVAPGVVAKATVTAESQVPAKIVLTAPADLAVNKPSTTADIQIGLQDASGQAILTGIFPLTVSLQGPATFADGTTGPETVIYTGNGQGGSGAATATASVQDVQGETGEVVVTVGCAGVPSATASIAAVIGGRQNQLTVTPPTGTITRDETAAGIAFGLQVTDANGLLENSPTQTPLTIAVTNPDGSIASDFTVDGQTQASDGYLDPNALKNGQFTIQDTAASPDTGTYNVEVSDPAGNLTAASPVAISVTPGAAAGIRAALASTGLWVQNPKTTLTVQVVDAFGNTVSDPGVTVQATPDQGNTYPVTLSPTSTTTNQSGQVTFTVQAAPDLANAERIVVTADVSGKTVSAFPEPVFMVEPWGP